MPILYKYTSIVLLLSLLTACDDDMDNVPSLLEPVAVFIGPISIDLDDVQSRQLVSRDHPVVLQFSAPIDAMTIPSALSIEPMNTIYHTQLRDQGRTLVIFPQSTWKSNTTYRVMLSTTLQGNEGQVFDGMSFYFLTEKGKLDIVEVQIDGEQVTESAVVHDINISPELRLCFNAPLDTMSLRENINFGFEVVSSYKIEDSILTIQFEELKDFQRYRLILDSAIRGLEDEVFEGWQLTFYTGEGEEPKFPSISQEELLTLVQERTFRYFWDFGHPVSGLARERNTSGDLVTLGGSGFGVMSILVGMERGFITRAEGIARIERIVDFLSEADRFHGAWPHWMNGETGQVIPFSRLDNGADLVETAFMIQGLLTARSYLRQYAATEVDLISKITQLWEEIEWTWFTQEGEDRLYWHWSPEYEWAIDLPISGYNEALIVYILAVASPTYAISEQVYHQGWARQGQMQNGESFYEIKLPLGSDYGGPLFYEHYSFQSLDPRHLSDQYANYWEQAVNHSLIHHKYSIHNPKEYVAYSDQCWGLTASDNPWGYAAHSPTHDLGVITPTAALSSMPYTPTQSLRALEFFYYKYGDRLWGEYGFYDAFSITEQWVASSYLAIDQGPIINMIENYRTGLLWDLFMDDSDIQKGLDRLGFNY